MNKSKQITTGILNLSTAEFLAEEHDFTKREFALLDMDFEGLAVNAPAMINPARQDRLPVVLATVETTRRQWEVFKGKNLILLACHIESGDLYLDNAYPPPEKMPEDEPFSRQPPEPGDTPPYTSCANIEMFQARERLNLPWEPGSFALAVISYDRVSNVVEVHLKGDQPPETGTAKPVFPAPKPNFPSYLPNPKTPKLSGPGLSFTMDTRSDAGAKLVVRGAFSTTAKPHHVPQADTMESFFDGQPQTVGAVVPLTFLIVGLDWKAPMRFDWAIPVYSSKKIEPGAVLQGYFAVDVLAENDGKLRPGTNMAYIVMEGAVYGPVEFGWDAPTKNL